MRTMWISIALTALVLTGCDEGDAETEAELAEADNPPGEVGEELEAPEPLEPVEPAEEAQEEQEEQAAGGEVSCEDFVDKLVELLGDTRGSFITADNRDEWVERCTEAGDLGEHEQVAACVVEADTVEESQACGELSFVNQWVMD